MKRRIFVLGLTAVLLSACAYVLATEVFQPKYSSTLSLHAISVARNDTPVVTIEENHVRSQSPGFHELLEEAHKDGDAFTTKRFLQLEILDYLRTITGSPDTRIQLLYKGTCFNLAIDTQ
jgi:hypothetical protein